MFPSSSKVRFAALAFLVVMLGIARADEPAIPAAASVWEMSPYHVQIYLRIDAAPGWTVARRKDFGAQVADRAAGLIGGAWRVDAAEAPAELHWDRASALDHVALDAIPAAALECDKIILIGLEQSADQAPSFSARELDVRTRLWGAVVAQAGPPISSPSDDLAEQAVCAAWRSFRPFGRIESLTDQNVTVTVRGGGLPAASPALRLSRTGSVWQPIIRHFDVAGRTVKDGVFPIADTWLRTSSVDGATAHCALVTGVQDPLALEYDGRTEYLTLAATDISSKETALVCLTHGPPERPLTGLDVLMRGAGDHAPRLVGQTDSSGTIRLTSDNSDVLMVSTRSGDDLLSRFPLVPGLEPIKTVRLEDTGRRPESARFVAAMRVELLDLATQQRLLLTRLQHEINGKSGDAAKTFAALRTLPTADQFLKSLDADRDKLTTNLADPIATAWLDKRLEEIKAAAPKCLLDTAKLKAILSSMRQK